MFQQKVTTIIILLSLLNGIRSDASIDDEENRIIGGEDALINQYPHQASFQYYTQHLCGGSIYNNKVIICAAHCVNTLGSKDIPALSIVVGTSTYASGGVRIPVKSFVSHQYFNRTGVLEYDVSLILLKTPLTFTSNIKPIALSQKTPENGAPVVVTGWGMLNNSDPRSSPKLQRAQLSFISRNACTSAPNKYSTTLVTPTMICAADNGKAPCRGDSGGPLVDLESKNLLGIVSWGFVCAAKNYPGVFTSVPALRNWITTTADKLSTM